MQEEKKTEEKSLNFIEEIVENDLQSGKYSEILTRFPPEPNGYLHIGHAKSICLNFGLAQKYGGKTNLRFDDTNPVKEDTEYVDAIKEDIKWLGFNWAQELYASDYFEQLYLWAQDLITKGLAYVDDQNQDEIRTNRGTVNLAGKDSPFRNRSVAENLALFAQMREGKFQEGACVLRAKIDMAHPNMMMRDPLMYRIIFADHHRTGSKWCIYPMYDYAHGESDSFEKITHSICTLEFDIHRPLYDWFIEKLAIFPSHQYEFARLNLTYTVMSKRKLLELVKSKVVSAWDDPRMPTICGLRRRGYTPESLRLFAERVGVAKRPNLIELSFLEMCLREDLNKKAFRKMAVLKPIKLIITNYEENVTEELDAVNLPDNTEAGNRKILFSNTLYIESDDFMEHPAKKYFRLSPGNEVRLKYAYIIKCQEVIKDEEGKIVEIHCTYDPETRSGSGSTRQVKGTIHWVSVAHAVPVQLRLYDKLFTEADMDAIPEDKTYIDYLNPESLVEITAYAEASINDLKVGTQVQFERTAYFSVDKDSSANQMILNRTVTLKDSFKKQ